MAKCVDLCIISQQDNQQKEPNNHYILLLIKLTAFSIITQLLPSIFKKIRHISYCQNYIICRKYKIIITLTCVIKALQQIYRQLVTKHIFEHAHQAIRHDQPYQGGIQQIYLHS